MPATMATFFFYLIKYGLFGMVTYMNGEHTITVSEQ